MTVRVGGLDTVAITATAITLGLLVLANVFIAVRRTIFNQELLDFARDPLVSEGLREQIVKDLLEERNRRY